MLSFSACCVHTACDWVHVLQKGKPGGGDVAPDLDEKSPEAGE
jgi:hypothetical protein